MDERKLIVKNCRLQVAALKTKEGDWNRRVQALQILIDAYESGSFNVWHIKELPDALAVQLTSGRSAFIRQLCPIVTRLCLRLSATKFESIGPVVVPAIQRNLAITTKVMRESADECLRALLTESAFTEDIIVGHAPRTILKLFAVGVRDKHHLVRGASMHHLLALLRKAAERHNAGVEVDFHFVRTIELAVHTTLCDSSADARIAARDAFLLLRQHWSERAELLLANLDPSQRAKLGRLDFLSASPVAAASSSESSSFTSTSAYSLKAPPPAKAKTPNRPKASSRLSKTPSRTASRAPGRRRTSGQGQQRVRSTSFDENVESVTNATTVTTARRVRKQRPTTIANPSMARLLRPTASTASKDNRAKAAAAAAAQQSQQRRRPVRRPVSGDGDGLSRLLRPTAATASKNNRIRAETIRDESYRKRHAKQLELRKRERARERLEQARAEEKRRTHAEVRRNLYRALSEQ
jgi:CLASP N terminal